MLVGLKDDQAILWKVFSNVVKPEKTINLNGTRNDPKVVYNFHEAIVNALRPNFKEGVKSIIVAAAPRTDHAQDFLNHVRGHHSWLTQGTEKATFAQITGTATTVHDVTVLTRTPEFRQIIGETNSQESENLLELLEKNLNASGEALLVLYSLDEIEEKILSTWLPGKPKPDYLMIVDTYLSGNRQKNRLQRIVQIAANRKVKSRIVKADSPAGKRILQFGGMVCILKET
jgi:stalled ribosome rescue protein Dom34